MGPRKRRGVLLLAVAALGAAGVFALVSGYVADVRAEVGSKVPVLRLTAPVEAFAPVSPATVEVVEVPERWAPETAISDPVEVGGLVAGTDLAPGSLLQEGMLVAEPELSAGEREVAILVDAETGVAGKIGPGSVVDILATFASSNLDAGGESRIVVEGASVIEVGSARAQQRGPGAAAAEVEAVVPVTFALSVHEALVLTHAESFAEEVRLGLRRPGSGGEVSNAERAYGGE